MKHIEHSAACRVTCGDKRPRRRDGERAYLHIVSSKQVLLMRICNGPFTCGQRRDSSVFRERSSTDHALRPRAAPIACSLIRPSKQLFANTRIARGESSCDMMTASASDSTESLGSSTTSHNLHAAQRTTVCVKPQLY